MAIMYLFKENFTCTIVQVSLYLSLVSSVDPDQLASEEAS